MNIISPTKTTQCKKSYKQYITEEVNENRDKINQKLEKDNDERPSRVKNVQYY